MSLEDFLSAPADEVPTDEVVGADVAQLPEYIRAANLHNYGASQPSLEAGEDRGTLDSIQSFIKSSTYSGVNEFYNMGQMVGGWFPGREAEYRDTADFLEQVDSNLVDYYNENKDAINVTGFVISSLVPGLGGVKALHVGQAALRSVAQTGRLGTNMSRAIGVLAPQRQKYVAAAIKDMTDGSVFTGMNTNVLKALGAGASQNFMEAAAFEVAAAAALYKSPIFESSDLQDIAWNVGIGTLLGGTIGTGIGHLLDRGAIKTGVRAFTKEAAPWATLPGMATKADPSDKLVLLLADKASKSAPPTPEIARIWERTNAEREILIRENLSALTKGDTAATEILFQAVRNYDDVAALQTLGGARQIVRMSGNAAAERELEKVLAKLAKDPLNDDLVEQAAALGSKTLHLIGEEAGTLTVNGKYALRIADTLKAGQTVKVDGHTVTAGNFKHSFKPGEDFNITSVKSSLIAEARYILAERSGPLLPGATIFEKDIPFLEKALREGTTDIKVRTTTGYLKSFASKDELYQYVKSVKEKTAFELATLGAKPPKGVTNAALAEKFSQQEIANIVNVKSAYLSGLRGANEYDALFARESFLKELNARSEKPYKNLDDLPTYLKVGYKNDILKDADGNMLEGMTLIAQKQKLRQAEVDRVAVSAFGSELADTFAPMAQRDVLLATPEGAGRGFLSFASGDAGSLASKAEYIGQRTTNTIIKMTEQLKERVTAPLYQLGQNTQAAREWAVIHQRLAATSEDYVFTGTELKLRKLVDFEKKVAEFQAAGKDISKLTPPNLPADVDQVIKFQHPELVATMEGYVAETARQYGFQNAVRKISREFDPRVVYPVRPDPKRYKFFAFVRDKNVASGGRSTMLYAQTEEDLAKQISIIERQKPDTWEVYTKKDAERYFKSVGQFEFDKTLHDAYFASEFKRMGVSSPTLVATDSQKIVDDTLNMLLKRENQMVREVVAAKYEPQFNALRAMGEQYTRVGTSKFGSASLLDYAENTVANPYNNYIKTALGFGKKEEYKHWFGTQEFIDQSITSLADKLTVGLRAAKSHDDLLALNKEMRSYGYAGPNYDAALEQLVNHNLPRAVLSDFGKKANAIMSALTLRTDWFNAINNTVGSHVLLYSQMAELVTQLKKAAPDDLRQLAGITVPGTDDWVVSTTKLHGNAIKAFWGDRLDDASPLYKEFKSRGFITSITDQQRHVLDDVTLSGAETVQQASGQIAAAHSKATRLLELAEKATGNLLAEEYNRFVAAYMGKQLADLAVAKGLMQADDVWPLVNTFVNRTQGNYIASQRPALLQGAVGQLMGLFQTYQFTLLQNLLRNVGDGNVKSLALMAGLQGTIYGMNGMPAFNAINTYLVGSAAGNPEFKDVHYLAYTTMNKDAAYWIMYGGAAALTGTNMYVRGDINPRQATIVPTTLEELPVYGGFAKTFAGIKQTVQGVANGGDIWQSFLSGIEHGSINRPLQGLATVVRGATGPTDQTYTTSRNGNIVYQNDLYSLASLARLGGAKPFDEAIIRDFAVRTQAYESKQRARTDGLYQSIKSTIRGGNVPTALELENFAGDFVKLGYDRDDFAKKVIKLYEDTNTTQADRLAEELRSPAMQKLQGLLAGPPEPEPEEEY